MVERVLLGGCFFQLVTKHGVLGYYCASEKCDFDQYCCGYNQCCSSYDVWQMWYFWLGLVIFLIFLAACFSFWRYRCQQSLVVQTCQNPYDRFEPASSGPSSQSSGASGGPPGPGSLHSHLRHSLGPGHDEDDREPYKDCVDEGDSPRDFYYSSPRKPFISS